jgi:hypothetical protein
LEFVQKKTEVGFRDAIIYAGLKIEAITAPIRESPVTRSRELFARDLSVLCQIKSS